ncbi:MAG: hypothetical protein SD837_16485 [Candidatus Electrothrix scaldis]|nr:MAG: hypothetical protein SD837_16485 [Candidatus Electrothrix sp. GW3-3]
MADSSCLFRDLLKGHGAPCPYARLLMHHQLLNKRFIQLTVSKYLFRLRAETSLRLPPYKGSALHGAFGHALKRISPFYYQELCASGNDGAAPRPYVLLPPLDSREHYPAGHPFSCELTLFGRAEQYFPICHAALEFLGREMGLGLNRGCDRHGHELAGGSPAITPERREYVDDGR